MNHNLRFALRLLSRSPGFTAVAVLTFALGIGANTALFTVSNALLLKPLPYADSGRLVLISSRRQAEGAAIGPLSWPRTRMIVESTRSFAGIAAFTRETFNLCGRGEPEQVLAARVSWNFFDVLGIGMEQGRAFRPTEDRPGGDSVVIASHALAARYGGLKPGNALSLDGRDYIIAGVLPPGFHFARLDPGIDLYAPRVFDFNLMTPAQIEGGVGYLEAVARLQPGASIDSAQAELDTITARYRATNPRLPDATTTIATHVGGLQSETVAGVRSTVFILSGAVGLVLLIACANVAGLLLSRAVGRRQEIAVRMAVGASRAAVVGQLLTESIVLSLSGGVLGIALGAWATRALVTLAHASLPDADAIHADGTVLVFTVAVSALCGVLFGLAPALQVSRPDLNAVLRTESRGSGGGRRRNRLRGVLVVAQVALSVTLMIGAGLLLRNFIQLRTASPGFDSRDLLTMKIALPATRYPKGPQMIAFYGALLESVRGLPGVRTATVSSALPVNPIRVSPALPEGQPEVPLMQRPFFNIQTFTPGYVAAMRVPLLRGREFTPHDDASTPTVAIVNDTVVRRFWPGQDPIGKHILLGRMPRPVEVVGVLGDIRNNQLAADVEPEIYLPFAQLPWAAMNLIVRTTGDPHLSAAAVRARILAIDRDQPVTGVQTIEELLDAAAARSRFSTTLLAALSGLALLLAVVGIYSVISYSVAERTSEIGIRVALGATRRDIVVMVVRQGILLAAAGVTLGLAAALVSTRLLAAMLYHVSTTDPMTFAAAALLFLAVAALASYIPARRAMVW
jgi:putative ABC transport system permease protein